MLGAPVSWNRHGCPCLKSECTIFGQVIHVCGRGWDQVGCLLVFVWVCFECVNGGQRSAYDVFLILSSFSEIVSY